MCGLRDGDADWRDRLRVQEVDWHLALRLTHCEKPDLVTEFLQPPRKVVDDDLGSAVGGRRYWYPGRGNQADPHLHCLLVSNRVTITLRQARQRAPGAGDSGRATGALAAVGTPGLALRSSAQAHGGTGSWSGCAGHVTSSGPYLARPRGGDTVISKAPITLRLEPITECILPRRKGAANVAQTAIMIS